MLTEDEKNHIFQEEICRAIARNSIDKYFNNNKNFLQRLLSFTNTSLGIFILSTIFVSLGSWVYSQWVEHKKIVDETNKLEQEISYRLNLILKSNQRLDWDTYLDIKNSSVGFNGQPPFSRMDLSAFPDLYEQKSIYSLSWQLYSFSNSKRNNEMFVAIEKYRKFTHDHAPNSPMNFKYDVSQSDSLFFEKEIKKPLLDWQHHI